jgi:hypothetical protein
MLKTLPTAPLRSFFPMLLPRQNNKLTCKSKFSIPRRLGGVFYPWKINCCGVVGSSAFHWLLTFFFSNLLAGNCYTLIFAARSNKTGLVLWRLWIFCEANVNKTEAENLLVSYKVLPLPSALKKAVLGLSLRTNSSSQNRLIFTLKDSVFIEKYIPKNLVEIIRPLPLQSVWKNGRNDNRLNGYHPEAKRGKDLWKLGNNSICFDSHRNRKTKGRSSE